MVVNKPPGMVAHPVGPLQSGTLCNAIQYLLDEMTGFKGVLRPGIVHRLDRQTSGAIVVALTHDAHVALSAEFENSRVSKSYLALVDGLVAANSGTIDRPIGRVSTGRHVLMSCRPDSIGAKPAKTTFRVIERFSNHSLLLAKPATGRNHQIRVHLAHIGHPIVGDEFYAAHGKIKRNRLSSESDQLQHNNTGLPLSRHALHALRLEIAHPIGGCWMTFDADTPDDFQKTLGILRRGH